MGELAFELASVADARELVEISDRAFNDPNEVLFNELGLLLRTDAEGVEVPRSSRIEEGVQRLSAQLVDADLVVNKTVDVDSGRIAAFAVWMKPDAPAPKPESESGAAAAPVSFKQQFGIKTEETRQRVMAGKPHWYLKMLCVDPDFQRRGIGKIHLDWAIERALPQGHDLYLESSPAGERGYLKAGFETAGYDELADKRAQSGAVSWPYMVWRADKHKGQQT